MSLKINLTRARASAVVLDLIESEAKDALVVAANGMISREVFEYRDRHENFYMIGSMGQASTIGLGLALAQPQRRVVVLDGDGNVLMGLGHLAMIAEQAPANLLHVVLDNRSYASTGGQRSISECVTLANLATAAGYRRVARVDDEVTLRQQAGELLTNRGPSFLSVQVAAGNPPSIGRVELSPESITQRMRSAATSDRPQ